MTAEIVNLNKVRKAKERAEQERQAEANRLKFGASKADRSSLEAETLRSRALLDGAKRETPGNTEDDIDTEGDIDPGSAS